jgi:DNA-binding MarR family transcriptional regulator
MQVKENRKLLISSLNSLRSWERENLPLCKTNAGYHVFLTLAVCSVKNEFRLKNIYHSLPFSERTIRLLLRSLESDGWIEMPQKSDDLRHKDIQVTDKFSQIIDEWIEVTNKYLVK